MLDGISLGVLKVNTIVQYQSSWKFFPRFWRCYSYFRQRMMGQIWRR